MQSMQQSGERQQRMKVLLLSTRLRTGGLALLFFWLIQPSVMGDVTVKKFVKSSGLGGFGAAEITEEVMIAGDKGCNHQTTKYTGKFASLLNKGAAPTTNITRLDKELLWTLNPEKKTYSEMTFEQMRQAMQSLGGMMSPAQADSMRKAMENLTTTIDVKKTGEKKIFCGLDCERVILTMQGEIKDSTGKVLDTTWMKNDAWIAPNSKVPAELRDFDRRFSEKLGVGEGGPLAAMMQQYGEAMKKLTEKFKELDGYPLQSTFSIVMSTHSARQARAQAPAGQPAEEAEIKEETPITEEKDVKSALKGLFGKKAKEAVQKKEAERKKEVQSPGPKTFFETTTEVQEIRTAAVDPTVFEIPAGYKKVEVKGIK